MRLLEYSLVMPSGLVANGLKDTIAVILEIFESAQHEIDFIVPPSLLSLAGTYGTLASANRFIQNGGVVQGVTTISPTNVEEMQVRLDAGEDLRHSDLHYEIFMFIGDRQRSISAINIGVSEYTRDTPLIAFTSEDPTYAAYLLTSFENVWSHAVPAEKRIRELVEPGAGQR